MDQDRVAGLHARPAGGHRVASAAVVVVRAHQRVESRLDLRALVSLRINVKDPPPSNGFGSGARSHGHCLRHGLPLARPSRPDQTSRIAPRRRYPAQDPECCRQTCWAKLHRTRPGSDRFVRLASGEAARPLSTQPRLVCGTRPPPSRCDCRRPERTIRSPG